MDRFAIGDAPVITPVATLDEVLAWRAKAHTIHIDDALKRYIVELVVITREAQHPAIDHGASPRATLAIANLARAKALLEQRDYAVPDDVRAVAPLALRHRIGFNFRVSTDGGATSVLNDLIARIPVP
jgi:MoxR-like ATPase